MIVCRACGFSNRDEGPEGATEFCGSCGRYLGWTGERYEESAAPEEEPVAAETTARAGLVERIEAWVREQAHPARPSPLAGGATTSGEGPTPVAPGVAEASASEGDGASGGVATGSATETTDAMGEGDGAAGDDRDAPEASASADGAPLFGPPPPPRPVPELSSQAAALLAKPRAVVVEADDGASTTRVGHVPVRPAVASDLAGGPAGAPPVLGPVQPAPARPRPVLSAVRAPVTPVVRRGDVRCPSCGQGNYPWRHFCRRCGTVLPVASPEAWYPLGERVWRVLTRPVGRRSGARLPAGERPGRRLRASPRSRVAPPRLPRPKLRSVAVAAVGVVLILTYVGPFARPLQRFFHDVKAKVYGTVNVQYVQLVPAAVQASSFAPGHPAELAADGFSTTFWASAGNGVGQRLTLSFAEPVNVGGIGVLSGAQASSATFAAYARPKVVELLFSSGPPKVITLQDTMAFQSFKFLAPSTRFLTLVVESVYPGRLPSVAVSELEAFTRT